MVLGVFDEAFLCAAHGLVVAIDEVDLVEIDGNAFEWDAYDIAKDLREEGIVDEGDRFGIGRDDRADGDLVFEGGLEVQVVRIGVLLDAVVRGTSRGVGVDGRRTQIVE